LFYFVHYKQFSLPQVTCLICVHKYGRVCSAIVCTESRHVRCMDLTNCYGRVLFKDRWSISKKTAILYLCFWES